MPRMSPGRHRMVGWTGPNNLMVIVGVGGGSGRSGRRRETDEEAWRAHLRLSPLPAGHVNAAGAFWADDRDFDINRHIRRVRLPGRGGETGAAALCRANSRSGTA